jgi:small conductance mechanosensitive channel
VILQTAYDVALNDLSTLERAVATLLTVAAALGLNVGLRRLSARRQTRLANLAAGIAAVLTLIAACVVLLVVWDLEPSAVQTLSDLRVQAEGVVRGLLTIAFFVLVYVGTDVLHRAVQRLMKRSEGITDHQAEITFRITQISVYILALLVVLGFWGIELGGLLIGAGFAGIVLGMAARQTLGAVIAGFVLMFSRPFEIGDWVEIGENDGIVTDITIVNTRLQTFDGEYVILPNDYVGSNEVVNRSRKGRLRIQVDVGVDYSTDVDRAMEVAKTAMNDVDDILTVPRPQVILREFGGSSVVLGLRFWIDNPSSRRMWRAQTSVISAVKEAFEEEGVKIPFPQRELSGRAETGGFQIREPAEGDAVVEERAETREAVEAGTQSTSEDDRGDDETEDAADGKENDVDADEENGDNE